MLYGGETAGTGPRACRDAAAAGPGALAGPVLGAESLPDSGGRTCGRPARGFRGRGDPPRHDRADSRAGPGPPSAAGARKLRSGRDRRVWGELAACFDTAEASGCPLADVLARFAAHLEAEDDAEAARQTALAGPRATVRLLTWLPLSGLGLGLLLGVDPVGDAAGNAVGPRWRWPQV